MRMAQDYELWLRAAARGSRMSRIGVPTVGYRQSDKQVSRAGGFSDYLLSERRLWNSYRDLVGQVLGPNILDGVHSAKDLSDDVRTTLFAKLELGVSNFRHFNRRYYMKAIRSQTATLIGWR